jgi:diacylglycerol O-acyltransferase / wax synthase
MEPISASDLIWLRMDKPGRVGHATMLLMFAPEAGVALGAAELREQIAERLPRLTPFRRKPASDPSSPSGYRWAEADVDLDQHVFEHRLAGAGDPAELGAFAARLNTAHLDHDRPLWEFHVISGLADGSVCAMIKLHHATGDGSVYSVAVETLFDHPREDDEGFLPSGRPPEPPATNVRRPEDIRLPAAPMTPFNQKMSSERDFAFGVIPLERLRAIKEAVGATHSETLLALWGGALRAWLLMRRALPAHPLVARMPVSTRTAQDVVDAGNLLSILLVPVPTHLADFPARAEAARGSIRTAMENPPIPGVRGLGQVNLTIATMYGPQPPMNWRGVPMYAAYSMGVVNSPGLSLLCITRGDEIMLGVHVDSTHVPDPWSMVRAFEAALEDAEHVVAEAGARR